ncbi:MAG: type II secretion system protein GspM [Bryobacteraceae bacterium]|nr:type II secretion system protein GspM [Bryobacteraceae bacterium]
MSAFYEKNKRALLLLPVVLLLALLVYRNQSGEATEVVAADTADLASAERRLQRLRRQAADIPAKRETLKQAMAELDLREKGLIRAETAMQAQAQVLQVVRRIARAQAPPVEIKNVELSQPRPLGDDYGEVAVAVSLDCRIDQVINILAALTEQPELIATNELRLGAATNKEKTVPVRLTVSGIVPRKLIPEKRGSSF